jgi:hypothetical protein
MGNLSRNTPVADDLTAVSETGRVIVKDLRKKQGDDDRITVERPVSQRMLNNIGATQHYKLEEDGRIKSFLVGSKRVILTASIYDYLIEEAIRSHPAGQPPRKLDKPLARRWRERREAQKASNAVKEKPAARKAQKAASAAQPRLPPLA